MRSLHIDARDDFAAKTRNSNFSSLTFSDERKESMRRPVLLFLASSLFMIMTITLFAQTATYTTPGPAQQQPGKVRAIDPSKGDFKIQKLASNVYLLQPVPVE